MVWVVLAPAPELDLGLRAADGDNGADKRATNLVLQLSRDGAASGAGRLNLSNACLSAD